MKNSRREFIGSLAATALTGSAAAYSANPINNDEEKWFDQIAGKHKMVFDCISVNEGYGIVWAYNFLQSNNKAGYDDKDLSVLVVLRNKAIPLAFQDHVWKKYKFGKFYKVIDYTSNSPADNNVLYDTPKGLLPEPGMSIKNLQQRGVLFCVCESAINVNTKQFSAGGDNEAIKSDWLSGIISNVQVVSSGVLALNRAQERGASYCYAG